MLLAFGHAKKKKLKKARMRPDSGGNSNYYLHAEASPEKSSFSGFRYMKE